MLSIYYLFLIEVSSAKKKVSNCLNNLRIEGCNGPSNENVCKNDSSTLTGVSKVTDSVTIPSTVTKNKSTRKAKLSAFL